MLSLTYFILSFAAYFTLTTAQFGGGIFEQMFGGGGGQPFGGQQHHHQQQQRPANVASDSSWYRSNFEGAICDKYLCPATLSCVDKPSHCPCAWPAQEDKVEFGDELAVCASKGGWKAGEMARKIELARKGLI